MIIVIYILCYYNNTMSRFKVSKLVRDSILDSMREGGENLEYRILSEKEYVIELKLKLLEEAEEIINSKDTDITSEIADITEVIDNLIQAIKTDKNKIRKIQKEKNEKFGSFSKKIYIDFVDIPDDSKWFDYYKSNPKKYPEIKEIYRKGVAAIILNSKNQILLVNLTTFDQNSFSIPGGGSNIKESHKDTIKRELFEELGIKSNQIDIIKKSKNLYRFKFKSAIKKDQVEYIGQEKVCFLIKFKGNDRDIIIAKDEVRGYVWSDYKNLDKYLLFSEQLDTIQSFIKELCPEIINYSI